MLAGEREGKAEPGMWRLFSDLQPIGCMQQPRKKAKQKKGEGQVVFSCNVGDVGAFGVGFKRLSANRMHDATPQERKAERQVVISCYDGWVREGKKEVPVMWGGF